MGPPSFQSECTLAAKKYSLAVAGFTRASHTSALDASIAMDALDTWFLSILMHSPCLTQNVRAHLRRRISCARASSSGAARCSAACLVLGPTALVVYTSSS